MALAKIATWLNDDKITIIDEMLVKHGIFYLDRGGPKYDYI